MSVRRATAVLAVALVLGLLLAAQPLRAGAEGMSSPAFRAVALVVTWPLAAVNRALHIEGARQWTLKAFGGGDLQGSKIADGLTPGSPEPTPNPPVSGSAPTAPATSTSTTASTPRFDAGHPLRVLVVGDSLVGEIAGGLVRMSDTLPMKVDYRYKASSGLVNTGFFDWPAELRRLVPQFKPDVTVMMYGNNDHLRLSVDGKLLTIQGPEWLAEYERRVTALTDIPASAGSDVLWIGMPIMRSDKFSLTARTLNAVFSRVCRKKGYWYLDAYTLFSNKTGKYSLYLPDPSGKMQAVRAADGIHLSSAGGDMVAQAVVRVLERHYHLKP